MSLLNSSGAPMRRVAPTKTRGVGGTAIYGGYIASRERSAKLLGTQRWQTYQEILANRSIVAAGVRTYLNLCAKPAWSVMSAELDPDREDEARDAADFVEAAMHGMETPWHRIVRRQAMYRFNGFSIQEWTAKRDDQGRMCFRDIEARPSFTVEKWDMDESGTVQGVVQRSPQTGQEIALPRWKLIYSVDDTLEDSPEGMGLLRNVVEPATRLEEYLALEQIGFQTDLRGIPVGRAPYAEINAQVAGGTLSEKDAKALIQPIEDFIPNHMRSRDTGVLLDSATYTDGDGKPTNAPLFGIELLKGNGSGQAEIAAAIQRINEEIARVLGVEHMLLGSGSSGSRALGDTKVEQFSLMVDATMRDLAETMEKDFIGPLWRMNGWDDEIKPMFSVESVQVRALSDLVDMVTGMSQAGLPTMPDDKHAEEIFAAAGLTPPARDTLGGGFLPTERRERPGPTGDVDSMLEGAE